MNIVPALLNATCLFAGLGYAMQPLMPDHRLIVQNVFAKPHHWDLEDVRKLVEQNVDLLAESFASEMKALEHFEFFLTLPSFSPLQPG